LSELIQTWILGLVGASFLGAIALTVCPKGRVRAVVSLLAGLVTLLALIAPVLEFDFEAYAQNIVFSEAQLDDRIEEIQREQERLQTLIISEQSRTYIWDKAQSIGLPDLEIHVETRRSAVGEIYPYRIRLIGDVDPYQRTALEEFMEQNFGITNERQQWSIEHEPEDESEYEDAES